MRKIGVIGAGAGGLCAARHILATSNMTPVVWEQSKEVGGTWVYTPNIGTDENGLPIHSSMYKNLKTNLPKEVMAFPDYPFAEGDESFLLHTEVRKYLESYAQHYKLHSCIKLGHHVEEVNPVLRDKGPPAWDVTVRDLASQQFTTTTCDALLVCNGHYSVPRMPEVKDIDTYKGRQIHSHNYREPLPYKGCKVVVLGAAASGVDITLELAKVAEEVLLSHNHSVPFPSEFPENVKQVRGVVAAYENGFIFADGSRAEADAIVYCTGYEYVFPFLTEKCGVTIENNIVKPLYKHMIHSQYPSMAFIGIPFQICPFPLFDFQVNYFMAVLQGKVILPSCQEMISITESEIKAQRSKGNKDSHFHMIGLENQLLHMKELSTQGGFEAPKAFLNFIIPIVMTRFIFSYGMFKKFSYKIKNDGKVIELHEGEIVNTSFDLRCLQLKQVARLLWRDFPRVMMAIGSLLLSRIKRLFNFGNV